MSNQITFVVSGSPVSFTPTAPGQNTYPLPAYDAQNSDLVVTSTCATNVYANWPGGGFTIKPGTTIMLTANAATLAATTNPNVFSHGCQWQHGHVTISVNRHDGWHHHHPARHGDRQAGVLMSAAADNGTWIVGKGSSEEKHLIRAGRARRYDLNLQKNLGRLTEEEYAAAMAETYPDPEENPEGTKVTQAKDMKPSERRAALAKIKSDQFKQQCEAADAAALSRAASRKAANDRT